MDLEYNPKDYYKLLKPFKKKSINVVNTYKTVNTNNIAYNNLKYLYLR